MNGKCPIDKKHNRPAERHINLQLAFLPKCPTPQLNPFCKTKTCSIFKHRIICLILIINTQIYIAFRTIEYFKITREVYGGSE